MKNGETRDGPRSRSVEWVRSISGRPPIPEPITTPTRAAFSALTVSRASATASRLAATA